MIRMFAWSGISQSMSAAVLPALATAVRVFFFQAEDGIRDLYVTGVQTCALPISGGQGPGAAPGSGGGNGTGQGGSGTGAIGSGGGTTLSGGTDPAPTPSQGGGSSGGGSSSSSSPSQPTSSSSSATQPASSGLCVKVGPLGVCLNV